MNSIFLLCLVCACASVLSEDLIENADKLFARIQADEEAFVEELKQSEFAALCPTLTFQQGSISTKKGDIKPMVFMHGMGDSCFNRGMANIAKESGEYMGVYSTCVPTGITRIKDTLNGFILSMDASVDVMAQSIKDNSELKDGFNCVGLSQGNNLCRGYIQKYSGTEDYPVAISHLSIHGPIVGVASLPNCELDGTHGTLCQEVSGKLY